MKIPSNDLWTQTNQGDVLGTIHSTQNCSLDTPGKVIGTRKPVALITSTVSGNFGFPLAITYFANNYNVLTDDAFYTVNTQGTYEQITDITGSFSNASDMVVYNSLLLISEDSNFMSWDGVTGDVYSLGALTAGVPHPMGVSGTSLVIGNGNTVNLYSSSYVVLQTLTLPTAYEVTTIRVRNNYIYIGTRHKYAGEASVFVWDGDSSLYNYDVPVGASWVFSMTEFGSTVAAITSQGQLGLINGTSFQHLAGLPVFYTPHTRWQGAGGLTLNGKVFNRGMVTIGNTIYMNIEGEIDTGFIPEMKSGLWVYDPEVGLYHKTGSSSNLIVLDAGVTASDSTFTTSVAHNLKTGDSVQFKSILGLTGIDDFTEYFVTVLSTTTFKISNSRKAVLEGRYVSVTGTASTDTVVYVPNTDYGSQEATSGAITATAYNETPLDMFTGEVIWGCRMPNPAGSDIYVLNTFSNQYNISRFETQRIYSQNIKQNWKEIYSFIDGIKDTGEEIVLKAQKKSDRTPTILVGAWLSTTVLNTNDTNFTTAWGDIEVGDEIVFTNGYGQGRTAHVTAIESSASMYSITVDEAIGTINGISDFYTTTFQKVTVLTNQNNTEEYLQAMLIDFSSTWVKIAVEMRGFTAAVNMFEVSNEINKGTK